MYSSTTLAGPSKSGCWRQLDYAEQHGDEGLFKMRYRSDLGIAAHEVMRHVAERRAESEDDIRRTAGGVVSALTLHGHTFRGYQYPPMPADDACAGADLAIDYLLARPLTFDAETIEAEVEYTHPTLPYRALLDLHTVSEEGEEEGSWRVVEVTDHKTSPRAGEEELHTMQRWGQAVVAWRNLPEDSEVAVIRQRVVNLRTWNEYSRDLWLNNPDDVAELEKWEGRIAQLCVTADTLRGIDTPERISDVRPVSPGAGCLACPWAHICPDVWSIGETKAGDVQGMAIQLAKVETLRALLLEALKASDCPRLEIPGGWIGDMPYIMRSLTPGKESVLVADWMAACAAELPEDLAPVLESFVVALKPGKTSLDAFAKALFPERKKGIGDVRDEYVASLTDERKYTKFGVWT